MDKQKIFDEIGIYIANNHTSDLHGFTLGNKIHLERKPQMLSFKNAPSKYELFFDIIDRHLDFIGALYLLKEHHFDFDNSKKFDLIIEYCIKNSIYDKHLINSILKHFIGEQI